MRTPSPEPAQGLLGAPASVADEPFGHEYVVERVEAAPTHRQVQVICVECSGPLGNREGKFALVYRRIGGRSPREDVLPFRGPGG